MLKGGKGLEDPHQFRESLAAQDRAQPRRQRAEVRPWNSHGPSILPSWGGDRARSEAYLRPPPLPCSPVPYLPSPLPGGTPNPFFFGQISQSPFKWPAGGSPAFMSEWGSQFSLLPTPTCTLLLLWPGKAVPKCWPEATTSPEKDGVLIWHCILITNRTISWVLIMCQVQKCVLHSD